MALAPFSDDDGVRIDQTLLEIREGRKIAERGVSAGLLPETTVDEFDKLEESFTKIKRTFFPNK